MLVSRVQGRLRSARVDDAARLADIFRQSWLVSYRGIIPARDLDRLVNRRGVSWWKRVLASTRNIVALEAEFDVVGYASFGHARGPRGAGGEIFELYILPEHQGHGLGELLFEGCRARMDERGFDGLVVWALSENTPAIEFYLRRGGRIGRRRFERVGDARLPKVALHWD